MTNCGIQRVDIDAFYGLHEINDVHLDLSYNSVSSFIHKYGESYGWCKGAKFAGKSDKRISISKRWVFTRVGLE